MKMAAAVLEYQAQVAIKIIAFDAFGAGGVGSQHQRFAHHFAASAACPSVAPSAPGPLRLLLC